MKTRLDPGHNQSLEKNFEKSHIRAVFIFNKLNFYYKRENKEINKQNRQCWGTSRKFNKFYIRTCQHEVMVSVKISNRVLLVLWMNKLITCGAPYVCVKKKERKKGKIKIEKEEEPKRSHQVHTTLYWSIVLRGDLRRVDCMHSEVRDLPS